MYREMKGSPTSPVKWMHSEMVNALKYPCYFFLPLFAHTHANTGRHRIVYAGSWFSTPRSGVTVIYD